MRFTGNIVLSFPCDKVSFFHIFLNLCNTGTSAYGDFIKTKCLCCRTARQLLTCIVPCAVRVIFISKYMLSSNMLTLVSFNIHLSLFTRGLAI